MNPYLERIKGFGAPRKLGTSERRVRVEGGTRVEEVEHWDGRQDATVTPDVIRYGARVHNTGHKRGDLAEVTTLGTKERKERYGEGR